MPEAVLVAAEALAGALAGAVLEAALLGVAAALLGAVDALAEVAGLEGGAEVFFELEQPANATAATRIGSKTRRCIFTTHSVKGLRENRGGI